MSKLAIILLCALLAVSCQTKVEPHLDADIDQCENCSMIISNVDHGAVAINAAEEMLTFCCPVCVLQTINKLKTTEAPDRPKVFLFDHTTFSAIPAAQAFIVQGSFRTTMGYGLLAFTAESDAAEFAAEVEGALINWNDLRVQYERADEEIELSHTQLEDPPTFEVSRGEIVAVTYDNLAGEAGEIKLSGYDFQMHIPAESSKAKSFVADKPGQGFVFQNREGQILASLFVSGDHTTEEADFR
jgi:nitrous oxide reductase accessory protein NosL